MQPFAATVPKPQPYGTYPAVHCIVFLDLIEAEGETQTTSKSD